MTKAIEAPKLEGVAFAIPCYRDVSWQTTLSLLSANALCDRYLWAIGSSLISCARNECCRQFLEQTDLKKLLFVDTDMSFGKSQVARILSHHVPIVGALAITRSTDPRCNFTVRRTIANPPSGLLDVDFVGTAFMAVTREALEQIIQRHPDRWYQQHGKRYYDFFPTHVVDGVYQGEDQMFCRLARAAGLSVYVDLDTRVGHRVDVVYKAGEIEIPPLPVDPSRSEDTFTGHPGADLTADKLRHPRMPDLPEA